MIEKIFISLGLAVFVVGYFVLRWLRPENPQMDWYEWSAISAGVALAAMWLGPLLFK